jgi:molecular chaperone GrpE (heat shock protein)
MFERLATWLRKQMRAALDEYFASHPALKAPDAVDDAEDDHVSPEEIVARVSDVRGVVEAIRTDVAEVADQSRKMARGQARMGVRLEEIERRVVAGPNGADDADAWGDLWDAMDLLDAAIETCRRDAEQASLVEGLRGVSLRLERLLAARGMKRGVEIGAVPDGKQVRVVGTESHGSLAEGTVVRVARAPIVRDGRVLREGEVITCRREG